jgi:hypothetical protein
VRLVASILVLAMVSQGCSIIGLGMGLQTPETETVESRGIAVVEPGTEMEIVVETGQDKTATLHGRFAGMAGDLIVLEVPEGRFTVNRRWIRRVTINSGTQWAKGLLVGSILDSGVLLVGFLLVGGRTNRVFR